MFNKKYKNFFLNLNDRFITSMILCTLINFILFFSSLFYFKIIIIFFSFLIYWEWNQFIWLKNKKRILYAVVFSLIILIIQFFFDKINQLEKEKIIKIILLLSLIWWIFSSYLIVKFPFSSFLWIKRKILKILFGILIFFPFIFSVIYLRSLQYNNDYYYGSWLICYVLLLICTKDIFSYFFGSLLGKKKLAPLISPFKTYEGLVLGIIMSLLFSWLFSLYIPISIQNRFIISLLTILSGILGDLTESMFKRCFNIKDTGSFLPGHGGILDRIDSLSAAFPVFLLLLLIF
ncbi:MAG: phosphatidate cytidylyltransferase [Arsenophonus sp.]|nr:MAG: phosphatidate cytidylyltransferase [Arsenophonus sp.]